MAERVYDDERKLSHELVEDGPADPNQVAMAASYVPGTDAEKRLVRKLDWHIIPTVWVLYTFSYLDRANIGNARTGGLERDFNLTSDQYSIILLVFFISYVLFEIPSNLIIARVRPSIYLSCLTVLFGAVAASMGATNNWQQLAAVRFCLGVAEAGFAPGVAFYLSSWYKRYELASRFALYYTATAVSGAFSGLLAGVITQYMEGTGGLAGWRWLFILEGAASSFVGLFAWYFLPDYPATTKWLTEEEQLIAAQRLAFDGIAQTQGATENSGEWNAIKLVFKDWRSWVFVVMYMLCTGAQTMQYFVPTLMGSLGWTGYIGQYHTIPLYAAAFVAILGFCFSADHFEKKPLHLAIAGTTGCLCLVIVVAQNNLMVKYVFMILGFGCIYACPPLTLTWVPNILSAPAEKRAVAIALVNALGNSASIYGVFLWPRSDAPRYVPGFVATILFLGLIGIGAFVTNKLFLRYPLEAEDAEEAVQREIQKARENGRIAQAAH